MKPKILISTSRGSNVSDYVNALQAVGAEVLFGDNPIESSNDADALFLCGGGDVDPAIYGEENNGSRNIDILRDERELALIKCFAEKGKPIMGVCRGLQILNVFFGGSLIQDLKNADEHSTQGGVYRFHPTIAAKGELIEALFGESPITNSYHHQAIKQIGCGLIPIQWSDGGKTVEAIRHKDLPIFAVQWHPERMCQGSDRYAGAIENGAQNAAPLFSYFLEMISKA
jgi:putative glutamine amidotransferase